MRASDDLSLCTLKPISDQIVGLAVGRALSRIAQTRIFFDVLEDGM
jgi:hypothetical protein